MRTRKKTKAVIVDIPNLNFHLVLLVDHYLSDVLFFVSLRRTEILSSYCVTSMDLSNLKLIYKNMCCVPIDFPENPY